MYRLAELSDDRRKRIGWGSLLAGAVLLAVSVLFIHVQVAETAPEGLSWVPTGVLLKGIGYLAAFAASQMLIAGAVLLWVLNQRMTWALAIFTAFLAWIELVMIFGMVPSEWLNYAQTDLDWSSQRVAVTIPPILVLGNEVDISWAVIKDSISMGYHLVMLGVAAVFALEVQKMREGRPAAVEKPETRSPYGRPLVRGES